MTHRSLIALVVLNAVLLSGLIAVLTAPSEARAQFSGGSQYLMIAGSAAGRSSQSAVYIIDLSNGAIAPIFVNTANSTIDVFAGRNVADDSNGSAGGSRGR